MNDNRLSTSGKPAVDRALLKADINKLLNRSDIYEIKEDGRILNISKNKYIGIKGGVKQGVQLISACLRRRNFPNLRFYCCLW
jgi:hypothetical protein